MSYKALYRSYRPKGFKDVVGQDHIITTLQNVIAQGKVGHAYLFSGPRGTGKTSVAHVFAREVNRNSVDQVVANELDIIELDAASNNGVAEIRSVIDNSRYAPTESKFKVYIIDEVHMLTKGAFNALLKTLEEPPHHVIFILATTEAHKIPVTILSRVQRFNFRRIDDNTIIKQLENVLQKENIKFDDESIRFIAKLSQGGMRDALSIADQAAAFGNGSISFNTISQVFGVISVSNQINLLNNAFVGKAKEVLMLSSGFIENGADIERLSSSLIDIVKDFIIFKKTDDATLMSILTEEEVKEINISVNYAYEALDVLMKLVSDLKLSNVPHQTFELALLKITKSDKTISMDVVYTQPIQVTKPVQAEIENVMPVVQHVVETKQIVEEVITVTTETAITKDETNVSIEKIFMTEEISVKEISQEPIIETEELEKTAEMVIEQKQDDIQIEEATEQILSTQDIPVGEINKFETNTDEIEIVSMFSLSDTDEIEVPKSNQNEIINSDEIINMLVQADRSFMTEDKIKHQNIAFKAVDARSSSFVSELVKTKFISSGKEFLIISSEDDSVISQVNRERKSQSFVDFTNEAFGRPLLVAAITKAQFDEIKVIFNDLKNNNQLPQPRPIEQMRISVKPKTEQQAFGESLFDDLFIA